MPNSILTSRVAAAFAVEIDSNLPVLANGNTMLDKNFVGGNGSTVDYLLPSYGEAAVGADITSRLRAVSNVKVPITLNQYSDGYSLDQVEQALALADKNQQVDMPFAGKFASDIQKVAIKELKLNAASATIVDTGSGAVSYTNIGKGIAAINAARSSGEKFGVMGSDLATSVMDSGLNFFQADLKESFVNGKLGTFRSARWFETPDMNDIITIPAQVFNTVTVTAYTEGASTMTIGGTGLTGTLQYGQILKAANVNMVDVYGQDTGKPYAIIVQDVAGVAPSGNAATITVRPIFWTAGPGKTVTVTPVGKAVTSQHASATSYQTALVWDKQAFVTASASLKGLATSEKKGSVGKVLKSLMQVVSDGLKGLDIFRMDALVGFGLARANWCSRVDVKIG